MLASKSAFTLAQNFQNASMALLRAVIYARLLQPRLENALLRDTGLVSDVEIVASHAGLTVLARKACGERGAGGDAILVGLAVRAAGASGVRYGARARVGLSTTRFVIHG